MKSLNLTAKGAEQKLILTYLQNNASDVLAEKINNGTAITKDSKTLLNKKNLDGFMKYACEEARKLAEKGATGACVKDDVVYGWAIHYFEENSIEGILYNEDGSEYKPVAKTKPKATAPTVKAEPVKPKERTGQTSLFDLFASDAKADEKPVDNAELEPPKVEQPKVMEPEPVEIKPAETVIQPKTVSPLYAKYMEIKNTYPHCIVAYRLGDFYEVFGDDAVTLADELDLTLTGRECGLEKRVPMIGFPYHAAERYFKSIKQKHSVAVCEDNAVKLLEESTEGYIDTNGEVHTEEAPSNSIKEILDWLNYLLAVKVIAR